MASSGTRTGRGPVRKLVAAFGTLVVVLLLALAVVVVGIPKATGGMSLTVLTGSMEPGLMPGDVVVDKGFTESDAADLRTGDVITFLPYPDDPLLVTHRIVGVTSADGTRAFVTKGDNNGAVDPWGPVEAKQIRGVMLFHVPKIGHVRQWAGGNTGYIVVGAAVLLIAYGAVSVLVSFRRRPDEGSGEPDMAASEGDAPGRDAR